jgi:hypothetical protein
MDKLVSIEGKCKVVEATYDHVERIYPYMRKADQIEVACMGHTPREALMSSLENDDVTLTALDADDVPFAMFGVGQFVNQAYIWCLGTDGVNDNAYDFLRASRKYTQALTKPYGVTFNYVHDQNKTALKWLKFCGAKFLSTKNFGGKSFYEFAITMKQPEISNIVQPTVKDFKVKVTEFENNLKTLDGALVDSDEIEKINPLEHAFGDGMYVRKIVMPSGQLIVSKIHRQTHPYFIMSGDVSVLTEEGVKRIKAPYHGMTKAGTKRILYTHEETTWITVQQTHETDLAKIEQETMAQSFDDPALTEEQINLLTGEKETI